MGEEGKNSEEERKKKAEDGKKVGECKPDLGKPKDEVENKEGGEGAEREKNNGDDAKGAEPPPSPPPPDEEIVMRVYMHCEGCARKVKRCLKGFDGVEKVTTDCRTHKVVVKGKKAAEDPIKVVERVQKKSGRKVELMTPLPLSKPQKVEEPEKVEEEKLKPEKRPLVISVVLKAHMHCEACAQEIKKRILKMKGVQTAEPDLKASQVTVKGIMDAGKLVEYIYKRTGKHAVIVKSEPAEKKPNDAAAASVDEKSKSDDGAAKKTGEGGGDDKKSDGEKKDEVSCGQGADDKEKKDGNSPEDSAGAASVGSWKFLELKRNEFFYYHPRYLTEFQAYPPQLFSDENPNACTVM